MQVTVESTGTLERRMPIPAESEQVTDEEPKSAADEGKAEEVVRPH